jgi:hypothetical protein
LVDDTDCKEELDILDGRTVGREKHYMVVAGVGCKQVGELEDHTAGFAGKAYTVAEVDQLGVDMFGPEARVQSIVGTPVVEVEETSCALLLYCGWKSRSSIRNWRRGDFKILLVEGYLGYRDIPTGQREIRSTCSDKTIESRSAPPRPSNKME